MSEAARFEKYVARLTDEETLILHKIVCRRATAIYEPMYRKRQQRHFRAAMQQMPTWPRA